MKKDIHPVYYEEAVVSCACGNNFKVGSTKKEIRVELCNVCHPFYTGKQKFVDTARRVEKFQEKMAKVKEMAVNRKTKKEKETIRNDKKINKDKPKTTKKTVSKKTPEKTK